MILTRMSNWDVLLAEQLQLAAGATFQWGTFDCALSVCDCICAMTGEDIAASFRGTYSDQDGANAILARYGGTLEGLVCSMSVDCGMPEVGAVCAMPGDVVLADNQTPDRALGIVDLTGRFAMCASDQGLARIASKRWLRAWSVGRL